MGAGEVSAGIYKRQVPIAIMWIIAVIMISEYYIEPVSPILRVPVDIFTGWASIIASFTTIMAMLALVIQYIRIIMVKRSMEDVYLAIYGLVIAFVTIILGTIIYSPYDLIYMSIYFEIMLPLFFAAYALEGFILMSALYRGFRARNLTSTVMLIFCLGIVICATPALVSIWPALGSTYEWVMSTPMGAATRAFTICAGVGIIGNCLRVLTGREKSLFGGE
jgi:hypothetical protein